MYLIVAGGALLASIPNLAGAIADLGQGRSNSQFFQLAAGLFFLGLSVSTILTLRAFSRDQKPRDRYRSGLLGMAVWVFGGCAFTAWGATRGQPVAVIVGIAVACSFLVVAAVGWVRLRRGVV